MELKSISTVILFVADCEKSKEFYTKLGFRGSEDDSYRVYINWFSIEFRIKNDSTTPGTGARIGIKVDDAQAFYDATMANGYTVIEPLHKTAGGVHECTITDLDGYLLTFFSKK